MTANMYRVGGKNLLMFRSIIARAGCSSKRNLKRVRSDTSKVDNNTLFLFVGLYHL